MNHPEQRACYERIGRGEDMNAGMWDMGAPPRISRKYFGPVFAVILFFTVQMTASANVGSPVYWSAAVDRDSNELVVKVLPHVRVRDVRCDVSLQNEYFKQMSVFTCQITEPDNPELEPDKEVIKRIPLRDPGVKNVEALLLFAAPALSSPKATAGDSAERLKRGVPPVGLGR